MKREIIYHAGVLLDKPIEAHACDSVGHAFRLATQRLYLVDGPIEYCAECAAKMLMVYEALGTYCHHEDIAPPVLPTKTRDISLEDVPHGG